MYKYIRNLGVITLSALIATSGIAFAKETTLDKVFAQDMLGADLAYLESIIGPARQTVAEINLKEYSVNNCHVEVRYSGENQSIESLSLNVTPQCSFDLNKLGAQSFDSQPMPVNQLTFGVLGPVDYFADCLTGCGNAYDPEIYELHQGSRADGWLEIMLSTISSYSQGSKWAEIMIDKEGDEWVMNTQFNCNPQKYNAAAGKLLKGSKIERITIGYGLLEKSELQRDCLN